ncbi:hypothetical protein EA661_11350 [Pseudoxanthomonas winnipegensis]|uniref:AlpA family phage regulatory protein n=1 Tax=Pseudoxanthomonas winnipegensis TaxID=2480810 RepID=A0A4Q8LHE3_9GAMM|nr:hypothetical protein [Pseudoxanthomonas winnipegensis]RZZ84279.1 hypothetical protein EA662_12370 [Pseudoxanthomonas winnipegensis]TAA28891.1 hypothetical protein EA661_11350 [Pseudoxanthomonas winnipegensis]
MSAAEKLPWQELAMTAEECGQLWGIKGEQFLRTYACKPGFPARLTRKPATWKAGEVVAWRDAHRAGGRNEKGAR